MVNAVRFMARFLFQVTVSLSQRSGIPKKHRPCHEIVIVRNQRCIKVLRDIYPRRTASWGVVNVIYIDISMTSATGLVNHFVKSGEHGATERNRENSDVSVSSVSFCPDCRPRGVQTVVTDVRNWKG